MSAWTKWSKCREIWDSDRESPYTNWNRRRLGLKLPSPTYGVCAANDPEAKALTFLFGEGQHFGTLPKRMQNPAFSHEGGWRPKTLNANRLPAKGGVIVGVIDDGIALSHSQFQDCDEKAHRTRILAAWQQSDTWSKQEQIDLPFGTELHQKDIDKLIAQHTTEGIVDEDAFNAAAGLVDMVNADGQRTLMMRDAHGTHVADIAGGNTDSALIFINMPSRSVVGFSGTLLEFLVMSGVLRIVSLADQAWDQAGHQPHEDGIEGFPIVINISFSKMAGAKDASSILARFLVDLNRSRQEANRSKVHFVFPAGNDNLLEGLAQLKVIGGDDIHGAGFGDLGPLNETTCIEVEIPPEDQSSNYVEIYSRAAIIGRTRRSLDQFDDIEDVFRELAIDQSKLKLVPPVKDLPSIELTPENGYQSRLESDGETIAQIYGITFEDEHTLASFLPGSQVRPAFVIAFAPTSSSTGLATCPAGRWKIEITGLSKYLVTHTISVQSDQSNLPWSAHSQRPKLIDDLYEVYDEFGRVVDSYDQDGNDTDGVGNVYRKVFRHRTINTLPASVRFAGTVPSKGDGDDVPRANDFGDIAGEEQKLADLIASNMNDFRSSFPDEYARIATRSTVPNGAPTVFVAAGYRASDGQAAPYSSTAFSNFTHYDPDAAYPTDDSPMLFGIPASGAKDGSISMYRGTSFAAAQATRAIAERLKTSGPSHRSDVIEGVIGRTAKPKPRAKLGKGRQRRQGGEMIAKR